MLQVNIHDELNAGTRDAVEDVRSRRSNLLGVRYHKKLAGAGSSSAGGRVFFLNLTMEYNRPLVDANDVSFVTLIRRTERLGRATGRSRWYTEAGSQTVQVAHPRS